jgi:hypothetical protein
LKGPRLNIRVAIYFCHKPIDYEHEDFCLLGCDARSLGDVSRRFEERVASIIKVE